MKIVAVITSTRAEYGLLKPLIKRLFDDKKVQPEVVITGAHLLPEFGLTAREVEEDSSNLGFEIGGRIDIIKGVTGDSPADISKVMGQALEFFGEYFDRKRPDAIVVLGDRYEMLSVCSAAMNARIPIIHIHGGETTEGAVDEAIRHSITKMSCLHFAATESYRRRIIQLGENPSCVFNCGALGVENVLKVQTMTRDELEESLGFKLRERYVVGTFHPVTLEEDSAELQTKELLMAIEDHPDITFLFTKAGADAGGRKVNSLLAEFAGNHENFLFVDSLGMRRYLSAVKGAHFVIGNSSSGIIEVPSFHVPTINIGDRQKGRIAGESVINCDPDRNSINHAIEKALDDDFRRRIKEAVNPYEKEGTSELIAEKIEEFLLEDKLDIKKHFYDLDF